MNTISFTIEFDLINLPDKRCQELVHLFYEKMMQDKPNALTFDQIKEIIPLHKLKYIPASIEHPRMEHIPKGEVRTRETKIVIRT